MACNDSVLLNLNNNLKHQCCAEEMANSSIKCGSMSVSEKTESDPKTSTAEKKPWQRSKKNFALIPNNTLC